MFPLRKILSIKSGCVTAIFCSLFMAVGSSRADGAQSPAAPPEDFGLYLVQHQADLAPFFARNGSALLGQAVPLILEWFGRIAFIALILGWLIDVLLGRGFASLFAPAQAETRPSLIYATGRLALNSFLLVFLGFTVVASVGNFYLEKIIIFLVILFGLVSAGLQIAWTTYFYRTKLGISILFYLTLIVVHGFLTLGVATPLSGLPATPSEIAFMNQTVTPKLIVESREARNQLASIQPARDTLANEAGQLRAQITAARAEQLELRKQIDEAKNSESYLFSRIVKIHAQGDLGTARDQLAGLLSRFPNGPLTGLVQGQLTQVTSEMAAGDTQRWQGSLTKTRLAAQAQTTLLARVGTGQATLSELRRALLGKSREQVSALFGPPSETASNRWGFGRQMVYNPLTNENSGLAVYFADGFVQGVDYYHGTGGDK